jgi:ABC-type spermidine/putrescine transport system permease subunit I
MIIIAYIALAFIMICLYKALSDLDEEELRKFVEKRFGGRR